MFNDFTETDAGTENHHDALKHRFSSKRNCVFLLEQDQECSVVKIYASPAISLEREVSMLLELRKRGVAVPRVFAADHKSITMEYLDGPLLLDIFEWQEKVAGSHGKLLKEPVYVAIYSLCRWLINFYSAAKNIGGSQMILGEVNFRNFIVKEQIYGLDFEQCRQGQIEEDIGKLCAFALTYAPPFTAWKIAMTGGLYRILSRELNLDRELLQNEIIKELMAIAVRRDCLREMLQAIIGLLLRKSRDFM